MADKTEKKPGFVARMKAAVKGFAANAAKFFRDTKSELKRSCGRLRRTSRPTPSWCS